MTEHHPLRLGRRSGRIDEGCRILGANRRSGVSPSGISPAPGPSSPLDLVERAHLETRVIDDVVVFRGIDHEDAAQLLQAIVHLQYLRQLVAVFHEHGLGAGVLQDVENLSGRQRRVYGHHHEARHDAGPIRQSPLHARVGQDGDVIAGLEVSRKKRAGDVTDAFRGFSSRQGTPCTVFVSAGERLAVGVQLEPVAKDVDQCSGPEVERPRRLSLRQGSAIRHRVTASARAEPPRYPLSAAAPGFPGHGLRVSPTPATRLPT